MMQLWRCRLNAMKVCQWSGRFQSAPQMPPTSMWFRTVGWGLDGVNSLLCGEEFVVHLSTPEKPWHDRAVLITPSTWQ